LDKFLIDQNFEKYKTRRIHLDDYTIKKMGLIGNQTVLKINDFHLYCTPYNIGLKSCSVLTILDQKEIDFFKESFNKIHSIHYVFQNSMYKKPVSLFLRCKILDLKKINAETRHCLVSLEYTVIPNDYKEILISIYKREEALQYLYKNEQFRNKKIDRRALRLLKIDDSLHLRAENGSEPVKMTIIETSMSILRIIGEDLNNNYSLNCRVQIEFFFGENTFFLAGNIVTQSESLEIPGYVILTVKLEFSNYLTDLLYQYFKKQSEQN
jgi:hypothetical protein